MKRAWWIVAALVFPVESRADHRFLLEPSLQVSEIADDNLNFSFDEPLRDRVNRITPSMALRFDSPRWRAIGSYSLDSERYMNHSALNSNRARERASIGLQYRAAPRLVLSINSELLDTSTLADLNVDTGLAGSRVRGRRLSFDPAATFQISPRMLARLQTSSLTTNVVNGSRMGSQMQMLVLQRHVTAQDLFNIHLEHSRSIFRGATSESINTNLFLARWIHQVGMHDRVTVQAGPRVTNGKRSLDFTAIVAHTWRFSSIAVSLLRNQTTVIGYGGAVNTEVAQTKFSFTPNRRLTAYATPAIYRSTHRELEGRVYRVAIGARYAITSLLDADVAYNRDTQNGAIDPLRANAKLSHATLSIGFATRWNSPDRRR